MQDPFCTIRTGDTRLEERMQAAAADDSTHGCRALAALQVEREALETPAETAELAALAARINADLDRQAEALNDLPPVACWRDIRDRHAAALHIDRARAGVAR